MYHTSTINLLLHYIALSLSPFARGQRKDCSSVRNKKYIASEKPDAMMVAVFDMSSVVSCMPNTRFADSL